MTYTFVISLLCVSVFVPNINCSDGCDDLDTSLCQAFNSTNSHMCNDKCISSVCKKFCGLCPLRCYTCHEVTDVSACNTVQTCPYSDDFCFTAQTFTDRFTETYRLGCASNNTCRQYSGLTRTNRINIDAGCCDTDKCNNKPPALLHLTRRSISTRTTSSVISSTDINPVLCKALRERNSSVCMIDCISKTLCPNTCSSAAVKCLNCDAVSSPTDCTSTTVCGAGHECYITETLKMTSSHLPAYQLGCTSKELCSQFNFMNPVSRLFGKRQESVSLRGGCCRGDLCNAQLPVLSSTTDLPATFPVELTTLRQASIFSTVDSTTSTLNIQSTLHSVSGSTTPYVDCSSAVHVRCPDTFFPLHGACFKRGPQPLTYDESKKYCEKHCLHLAEFDRVADMESVTRHFLHHYHDPPIYVGAIRMVNQPGVLWSWERAHLSVDSMMWTHYNDVGDCAVTREKPVVGKHGHFDFGLENVNCNWTYRPLCQLYLHVHN